MYRATSLLTILQSRSLSGISRRRECASHLESFSYRHSWTKLRLAS